MLSSGDIKAHDIVPPLTFRDEISHTHTHTQPQTKIETKRETEIKRDKEKQASTSACYRHL